MTLFCMLLGLEETYHTILMETLTVVEQMHMHLHPHPRHSLLLERHVFKAVFEGVHKDLQHMAPHFFYD